ncbi:MAG: YlmH/Sll1252 family protein [Clostridia bacterium]|nr:YlmH/Sll1252 family protein [Clostridia bacterium]
MSDNDKKLLSARLSDLANKSERGYVCSSGFLDPAEAIYSKKFIKRLGKTNLSFFFGGYKDAERRCLFFLPAYYEGLVHDTESPTLLIEQFSEDISSSVQMISISGSGYKNLTHRDYMGAILNMGIDRSAVGDICVTGENSCVLFAAPAVASLICSGLERIGTDKVKTEIIPLSADFSYERKMKDINHTVASDRVDCVVSALCGESREKSKSIILSGLVDLNYSSCTQTDTRIKNGDIISIRKVGKFIIFDITEETKKGRLRLSAKKYI